MSLWCNGGRAVLDYTDNLVYNWCMRNKDEYDRVLSLSKQGLNQSEVAKIVGIPRPTVAQWIRNEKITGSIQTVGLTYSKREQRESKPCFREWSESESESYCYLLGLYLGDGCVDKLPRTYRLRFFIGDTELNIIKRVMAALKLLFPFNKIGLHYPKNVKMCVISCHSTLLPDFFPQTGNGLKSSRNVSLVDWQRNLVKVVPGSFVEGLFHSDGCFDANYTKGVSYPRYSFVNTSDHIVADLVWALELIGITPKIVQRVRQSPMHTQQQIVYVAKQKDVKRLNVIIGEK